MYNGLKNRKGVLVMFSDDFWKQYKEFTTRIVESVVPIIEDVRKTVQESIMNFPSESFVELGEMLRGINDEAIQFKSIIVELGYPPHTEISIPLMRGIVSDYNEHGIECVKEYIDEVMIFNFDYEFLDFLSRKWEKNEFVKDRIQVLRNVIKCHNQQMYSASIPTLLPQLEGIIAKGFKHEGILSGNHQKIYLKNLLIDPSENEDAFKFEQALHNFYLQHILVNFKHGEVILSDVSRHAILHGGKVDYGSEANSLKIILAFDFLLDSLSSLTEDVITDAHKEIRSLVNQSKQKNKN
ncbi:hypothetical protein [Cytobacillus oceanisediminis]|uniref:hypothetical protein n=1 Tax=Cytobacillus oceanisediminis TaxID=665099 RepID=UPI001FB2CFA5|nr:hypothetical protein [Cytobacillus oceanisediminis]UOE57301.1 hypothetical protein IRB79_11380 [Cytobacillus oceanisediminis]